jgi:hypothetical protein
MGITHRCRDFIILMNASADANPESNKTEYKEDHKDSEAACFQSYSPQSGHECVDGENLVR